MHDVRRDRQHVSGAYIDDLGLVLPEVEPQRPLEDVGQLLVVVRMRRDDRALRQVDVRDHQVGAGDEPAADQRVELLAREIFPAVMDRPIRHDAESMERWATFDCYGTLIDWNGGIGRQLERLFGAENVSRLLHGYHELERGYQREHPEATYREVLTVALVRLAEREGLPLAADEQDALARSLPEWEPFPEVPAALEDARARAWKLAILSNTDRDYIEASLERIGVPFELAIVASEVGSYKPGFKHWEEFEAQTGVPRDQHVHVGASLYHDVAPATRLGLRTVWINRLGEDADPEPDVELHTLTGLGEALDGLA